MPHCNQYNYLMLILAQQECKSYTFSKDEALVNACTDLYEKFMTAREECAKTFLTDLAAKNEKKLAK